MTRRYKMSRNKIQSYEEAAYAIRTSSGAERLAGFGGMTSDMLLDIVTGDVNAKALAAALLQARGLGIGGKWVGFEKADEFWKNVASSGELK